MLHGRGKWVTHRMLHGRTHARRMGGRRAGPMGERRTPRGAHGRWASSGFRQNGYRPQSSAIIAGVVNNESNDYDDDDCDDGAGVLMYS